MDTKMSARTHHSANHRTDSQVGLDNIDQVEQAIFELVNREFLQGAFFQTLLEGEYSIGQIRYFAIQYSYYSRHFPRVLGAAISAMAPFHSWWMPLADNLWDEAGRGENGRSHEELYRTFLVSVDPNIQLDEHGVPKEPMSEAVGLAIQTFLAFFRNASPLEAMAAVGFGSELFAGLVMGTIGRGLKHSAYNQDRILNVFFWEAHADEHEPRHYQLCKDVLVGFKDPADLAIMHDVGASIAKSEARMYAQLHQEMLVL